MTHDPNLKCHKPLSGLQQHFKLGKVEREQKMLSSYEEESDVNINDLWKTQKREEGKVEARVSKKIKKKMLTM